MEYTKEYEQMRTLCRTCCHGPAPIPQEGGYDQVMQIDQISGLSHSVGTCAMKQGACKLTLNVKNGVIQEALVEVLGCSGMTQSAMMAAEILPGKTLLEALNTDLVCDAINVAMREYFLNMAYGRTQTAFSGAGLPSALRSRISAQAQRRRSAPATARSARARAILRSRRAMSRASVLMKKAASSAMNTSTSESLWTQ